MCENGNEYDLLNINFIEWIHNNLISYYNKLELVYVQETVI